MIFSLKNDSDQSILLKSIACVLCMAVLVLLLVRHAAPALPDDRSYGGSVLLMLPEKSSDISNFKRWQMLNQPGNIFGYNSGGVFSALLPKSVKEVLPEIPHIAYVLEHKPALLMPEYAVIPLKFEKSSARRSVLPTGMYKKISQTDHSGIPVFDAKGNICAVLNDLPVVSAGGALLIRSEKGWAGPVFRIIESSGNREFDTAATAALENIARQGSEFSGVLAVWPELRGEK